MLWQRSNHMISSYVTIVAAPHYGDVAVESNHAPCAWHSNHLKHGVVTTSPYGNMLMHPLRNKFLLRNMRRDRRTRPLSQSKWIATSFFLLLFLDSEEVYLDLFSPAITWRHHLKKHNLKTTVPDNKLSRPKALPSSVAFL